MAGEQYSTIFKDTRQLGSQAVKMVDAVLKGQEPEVNDSKTHDNKVKVVPAFLLKSVIITKDNYEGTHRLRLLHRGRHRGFRRPGRSNHLPGPTEPLHVHEGSVSTSQWELTMKTPILQMRGITKPFPV